MRRTCLLVITALTVIFASGCITHMSGIAPSTTPISANDTYTTMWKASGSAWGAMLLCVPVFEHDPSRKAVERAVRNGGGNALIEVSQDTLMIYLYYAQIYRTRVEGTAINVTRGADKGYATRE